MTRKRHASRAPSAASMDSMVSATTAGRTTAEEQVLDPAELEEYCSKPTWALETRFALAWLQYVGHGANKAYYLRSVGDLYDAAKAAGISDRLLFPRRANNGVRKMEGTGLILDYAEDGIQQFRPSPEWLTRDRVAELEKGGWMQLARQGIMGSKSEVWEAIVRERRLACEDTGPLMPPPSPPPQPPENIFRADRLTSQELAAQGQQSEEAKNRIRAAFKGAPEAPDEVFLAGDQLRRAATRRAHRHHAGRSTSACFMPFSKKAKKPAWSRCTGCGAYAEARPYSAKGTWEGEVLCFACFAAKRRTSGLGICHCWQCELRRIASPGCTLQDVFTGGAGPIGVHGKIIDAFFRPYDEVRPPLPLAPGGLRLGGREAEHMVRAFWEGRSRSTPGVDGVPAFPRIDEAMTNVTATLRGLISADSWDSVDSLVFMADNRGDSFDLMVRCSKGAWEKKCRLLFVNLVGLWEPTAVWFARVMVTLILELLFPAASITYTDTDCAPGCSDLPEVLAHLARYHHTSLVGFADAACPCNTGCYYLHGDANRAQDPARTAQECRRVLADALQAMSAPLSEDEAASMLELPQGHEQGYGWGGSSPGRTLGRFAAQEGRFGRALEGAGMSREVVSGPLQGVTTLTYEAIGTAHWRTSLERRALFDSTPLEGLWVRNRRELCLAWMLASTTTQLVFRRKTVGPAGVRPDLSEATLSVARPEHSLQQCGLDPGQVSAGGLRPLPGGPSPGGLAVLGGLLYEQGLLPACADLAAPGFRPPVFIPAVAAGMESGLEFATRTGPTRPPRGIVRPGAMAKATDEEVKAGVDDRALIGGGRGPSFMTVHAYGGDKGDIPRVATAAAASAPIPLALAGDSRTGETSVLLPPPDQLERARKGWVRTARFKGIVVYIRMPEGRDQDWPITVFFAGHAAKSPGQDVHHGGCTIWVSTEQSRRAQFPSYGSTMQECKGRELNPTELGSAQAALFRQLFTERPWFSPAAVAEIGRVLGEGTETALKAHREKLKPGLLTAQPLIQEVPPDMLFIRHVERLVAGFKTLTDGPVHLVGASAGTHSAACLAVHAEGESRAWIDYGSPVWRPDTVLLVAVAAPSPYIQALSELREVSVTFVQSAYDELCKVGMTQLESLVSEVDNAHRVAREGRWRLVSVIPPAPCLARAVLGSSGHGYTSLASDPEIRRAAATRTEDLEAVRLIDVVQREGQPPGVILTAHLMVIVQLHLAEVLGPITYGKEGWGSCSVSEATTRLSRQINEEGPSLALAVRLSRAISQGVVDGPPGGWWSAPDSFQLTEKHREALQEFPLFQGERNTRKDWGCPSPSPGDERREEELDGKMYAFLAKALFDANADRHSDFVRVIASAARVLGHRMAPQLIYALALPLVQTLSQETDDRRMRLATQRQHLWDSMKSDWRTTAWAQPVRVEVVTAMMGDVYVYYCTADEQGVDLAGMKQFETRYRDYERSQQAQAYMAQWGKGGRRGSSAAPGDAQADRPDNWRLRDGDVLRVALQDGNGVVGYWHAVVQGIIHVPNPYGQAGRTLQLVSSRPMPYLEEQSGRLARTSWRQVLRVPIRLSIGRVSLLDSLSRDAWAPFFLMTGLSPPEWESDALDAPCQPDHKVVDSLTSMRTAMAALLGSDLTPEEVEAFIDALDSLKGGGGSQVGTGMDAPWQTAAGRFEDPANGRAAQGPSGLQPVLHECSHSIWGLQTSCGYCSSYALGASRAPGLVPPRGRVVVRGACGGQQPAASSGQQPAAAALAAVPGSWAGDPPNESLGKWSAGSFAPGVLPHCDHQDPDPAGCGFCRLMVLGSVQGAPKYHVATPTGGRELALIARMPAAAVLAEMYAKLGLKGAKELARRVLGKMAALPPFLAVVSAETAKGLRTKIINGPPGAAKTDLLASFLAWGHCFGQLRVAVVNQQNSANTAVVEGLLNFCHDKTVSFAGSWRVMTSEEYYNSMVGEVPHGTLEPRAQSRYGEFRGAEVGIVTAGMVTRSACAPFSVYYEGFDMLFHDEMQSQSGDAQCLSVCVLRPGGLHVMMGDWHQTRTRPDSRFDFEHTKLLEDAFPGGPFHPRLQEPAPLTREAVAYASRLVGIGVPAADVSMRGDSDDLPDLGDVKQEVKQEAADEGMEEADWGVQGPASGSGGSGSPQKDAEVGSGDGGGGGSSSAAAPSGVATAPSGPRATDGEVRDYLFGAGHEPVARYRTALVALLSADAGGEAATFSRREAYGTAGPHGVLPGSLVHNNRLRVALACLVGHVWGYPAEPLTGHATPCPPGPAIERPIGKFPVPLIVLDAPVDMYRAMKGRYRGVADGQQMPVNMEAVRLVANIRTGMFARGARIATAEKRGEAGRFRAMFAYRVDAEASKADGGFAPTERTTERDRWARSCHLVSDLVLNRSKEDPLNEGEFTEALLRECTVADTGISATGQTSTYGVSVHERATAFTTDPRQFLVMATRTREFTVMVLPFEKFVEAGGPVGLFLKMVRDLGWVVSDYRVGHLSRAWEEINRRLDELEEIEGQSEDYWLRQVARVAGKFPSPGLSTARDRRGCGPPAAGGAGENMSANPARTPDEVAKRDLVTVLSTNPGGQGQDRGLRDGLGASATQAALAAINPLRAFVEVYYERSRLMKLIGKVGTAVRPEELLAELIQQGVVRGTTWRDIGDEWLGRHEPAIAACEADRRLLRDMWSDRSKVVRYLRCNAAKGMQGPRVTTIDMKIGERQPKTNKQAKARQEEGIQRKKMRVLNDKLTFLLPLPVAYDFAAHVGMSFAMHAFHQDATVARHILWGLTRDTADGTLRFVPEVRAGMLDHAHFGDRQGNDWLEQIVHDRLTRTTNDYSEEEMKYYCFKWYNHSHLRNLFGAPPPDFLDPSLRLCFRMHPMTQGELTREQAKDPARVAEVLMQEPVDGAKYGGFAAKVFQVMKMACDPPGEEDRRRFADIFRVAHTRLPYEAEQDNLDHLRYRNPRGWQPKWDWAQAREGGDDPLTLTTVEGSVVVARAGYSVMLRSQAEPPIYWRNPWEDWIKGD